MKKIIYFSIITLLTTSLQPSYISACHDYSDAPKDYSAVYHNGQWYGYLGKYFDWESNPDYHEDGIDTDYDGIDGDRYDDGLSSTTLSGYTWIVTPGENALLTFTARQLTPFPQYNWLKIWIDWNKNNLWEENERVIKWGGWVPQIGNSISVSFNVPIPSNFTGQTWLRARISSTYSCFRPYTYGDWLRGEVEDYKVVSSTTPLSPVPEPNTLFLLGSGLFGLVGRYLKKRFIS